MSRVTAQMIQVQSLKPVYHSEYLEIILVLKGTIKLHKIERVVEVHAGEFSFINRNIVHYIESDGATIISFKINLASFKHIFERIEYVEFTNYNEFNLLDNSLKEKMDAILLDLLINEYRLLQSDKGSEELVFIEDQLVQMLFSSYQLVNQMKEEEDYINSELVSRYYYVVEYVFEHIGEKIIADDITNKLYMNSAYFSQFMKKVGGVGFKEFVLYRKLTYITALLLDKNYSLDEISLKAGITDTKSFYSLFKKYFNTSPSKWRKSISMIDDSYCYCEDMVLLNTFIEEHKIDKHKENTIARYIKYFIDERNKKNLHQMTIVINPYEDMNEDDKDEYQAYKYLSSLLKIVDEYDMTLNWIFLYENLRDVRNNKLYFDFLSSALFNVGYSRVRRWNISIVVYNSSDILPAKKLVRETEKMVNGIQVDTLLKI